MRLKPKVQVRRGLVGTRDTSVVCAAFLHNFSFLRTIYLLSLQEALAKSPA